MKSKFIAALSLIASAFFAVNASAQLCNKNIIVNFESNKSDILAKESPKLDSLIKIISNTKESFLEVYGHTDAKGTEEFNFKLADQRIKAVKAYIADKTKGKTITIKEYNFGEDR